MDVRRRFENDMPRILSNRLQRGEINLSLSRWQMIIPALRVADVQSYRIEGRGMRDEG